MGLFNTLNDAKQENDLARRDGLLQELRTLAEAYPADAAVREQLATGLYNTLVDAKQEEKPEQRTSLLEELRQLIRDNPHDPFLKDEIVPAMEALDT